MEKKMTTHKNLLTGISKFGRRLGRLMIPSLILVLVVSALFTNTVVAASIDMSVTTTLSDTTPEVNQTLNFVITARNNTTGTTATSVVVNDVLPATVTFGSATATQGTYDSGTGVWSVGSLAGGASRVLTITVTVNQNTAGQTLSNTATVTAPNDTDPVATNNSATASATISGVDLQVTSKAVSANRAEGSQITYTIIARNNSATTPTQNVILTDQLPVGLTYFSHVAPGTTTYTSGTGIWNIGTMAANTNLTLTITATINAGTAAQTIRNTATISATGNTDPTPANDSKFIDVIVNGADLQVTKTVNNTTPKMGENVVFTVAVRNNGPQATNFRLTDLLPAGLTYVSHAVPVGTTYTPGTGLWNTTTALAVNATYTLTLTAKVNAGTIGTTITNTASITSATLLDSITANNTSSASVKIESTDLALTKTVDKPMPYEGDTVVFTVTLTNSGLDGGSSIVVTDLLPGGVTYVSAAPSQGTYANTTGLWTVGSLGNGATATLAITATVDYGTAAKTLVNNVSITSADQDDPVSTNNTASASLLVHGADLGITKTVDDYAPVAGQSVVFTLTVTNYGPDATTDVRVTDHLNYRLRFTTSAATKGFYRADTSIWQVGALAVGESASLDIRVTVIEAATIPNLALISHSDMGDSIAVNNQASVSLAGGMVFEAGACVIDMGIATQAAGLKPYGLLYDLIKNYQIPIYWSINPEKVKDGADFTVNAKEYKAGPFIIEAEWVPFVQTAITTWRAKGVVIDCNLPEFTAPIYDYVSSFPNSVLDQQNGPIAATSFFTPAEIPTTAYRLGTPDNLVDCDDVYYMPHADPEFWSATTQANFEQFIIDGGALFAACKAPGALESPLYVNKPFLSSTGLLFWNQHVDGDLIPPPYLYNDDSASDPIMQHIGHVEGALVDNGYELIYLPVGNGSWRPTTTVAVWDPNQNDVVAGTSPGKAAVLVYGRAYGNPDYGLVVYQGSHSFNNGTVPERTAAARTLGNLLLQTGIEGRPQILTNIPDYVEAGQTEYMSAAVSGGTPGYTYKWTSSCGGTFSNPNAADPSFTAPIFTTPTSCMIRLVVQDSCGRVNFKGKAITINGATGLALDKDASPTKVAEGDLVTYTIVPQYDGSLGLTQAVVNDVVPEALTFVGATASGTYDAGTNTVTWNLGSNLPGVVGTVPGNPASIGSAKIFPSADTYIDRNNATTNFGTSTVLDINPTDGPSHPLLQFTLPTGVSSDAITSATLYVNVRVLQTNNTSVVRRMLTPWTETGATWNDSNGAAAGDWAGGNFNNTSNYDGTTSYGTILNTSTGWKNADVTNLVKGWLAGTYANNGVVLLATGTSSNDAEIFSREQTGDIQDPYLDVQWSVPANVGTMVAIRPESFLLVDGGQIKVDMKVTVSYNSEDVVVTPPANLSVSGGVTAALVSGPEPASAVIPDGGGSVSFTYVYNIGASTVPESVGFSGVPATTTTGISFATGTSKTVIISPVLQMQARVDSPLSPTVNHIDNTARVCDSFAFVFPNCRQDSATIMAYPVGGSISGSLWLDENSDGVSDAGESGISNVQVTATWYGPDGVLGGDDDQTFTTWTDAVGNYAFSNLPAGEYGISVNNNTLADGLEANPTYDPDGVATPGTSALTLGPGAELTEADFGYNWASTSDVLGNTGTGALGDRVWADADGDGVRDPDEPGIAGVTVQLYSDNNADGVFDTLVTTTTTGADGTFIFDGLPAGAYEIVVTGPTGYSQSYDPDGTKDNKTTSPIVLAPGDVFVNADFGYLPNAGTTASISANIWQDSNGDGTLDASESGIAGVTVSVIQDTNSNGVWDPGEPIIAATATGSDGSYSFDGLPVGGDYLVWVNDTDNVLTGLSGTSDSNGAATPNISAVTDLSAGGDTSQNFGYASPLQIDYDGVISSNIWYDANGNGVADPGEGLPGVLMTLTWYGEDGVPGGLDDVVYTTYTDANGDYTFGDLPAGNFKVVVDPNNFMPGMPLEGLANSVDPNGGFDSTSLVTLQTNESVDIAQSFGYTGPDPIANGVVSTVFTDLNGDGVQNPDETGIPGVVVQLTWYGPDGLAGGGDDVIYTTVTDENGSYAFENLPDGYFSLTADLSANSDSAGALEGMRPTDNGADSTGTFSLDPEGYFSSPAYEGSQNFGLSPTDGVGDEAIISSTVWYDADSDGVQDSSEAGIPGVSVTLTWYGPDGVLGGGDDAVYITQTDANGNYTFADLPAGTFNVVVDSSNFAAGGLLSGLTNTFDADGGMDNSTMVSLSSNQAVNLAQDFGYSGTDPQPNSVPSTLFNDVDGDGVKDTGENGIPDVVVQLTWYGLDGVPGGGDDVVYSTVTDASGNYSFEDLPDGYYGITTDLPVNTGLGGVLEGMFPTDMGSDGSSTFSLDPMHGSATGISDTTQLFGYSPSETQTAIGIIGESVFLDRDGDGMTDPGEGVEGVRVDLYATDGVTLLATRYTDANGNYSFGGLPEGDYYVKVVPTTLPGGGTGVTNSSDPDGGANNMSMVSITAAAPMAMGQNFGYSATTPNIIQGTIWDDVDGDGTFDATEMARFAGVTVALYDSNGNVIATTITDSSGNYSFSGLPNGTYSVHVTDDLDVIDGEWHSSTGPDSKPDPAPVTVSGNQTATADFGFYAASGLISDLVWDDLDRDGIQDVGEPGMAGIQVTLTITYPNGSVVTLVTLTDSNGHYSFDDLLMDENYTGSTTSEPVFSLSVAAPLGYLPTESNVGTDDSIDSDPQNTAITVIRGVVDASVDFGLSAIAVSGTISPDPLQVEANPGDTVSFVQIWSNTGSNPDVGDITVYDIPSGFGVTIYREDPATAPALGAYTTPLACPSATCLLVAAESSGDRTILDNNDTVEATNDTRGDNIPDTGLLNKNKSAQIILQVTVPANAMPGDYVLIERGSSNVDWRTFHPKLAYNNDLVYHDQASKIIRIPGATASGTLWVDEDSDGVNDLHESGIANVDVSAVWYGLDGLAGTTDDVTFTTTTDANGQYVFTDLPGGQYDINVSTGTLADGLEANPTYDPDGTTTAHTTSLTLAVKTEEQADFGYNWASANEVLNNTGNGALGGELWIDSDGDGVQDPEELGLGGVTVTLYGDPDNNGVYDTLIATVLTAADGSYVFDNLPAGGYVISTPIPTGSTVTGDPDAVLDGKTTTPVILPPGDVYLGADFGYKPTAGSVIGDSIYLDTNGDGTYDLGEPGIAGVSVSLMDSLGNIIATTTTDANGNYEFTGVPAGTYTVWVNDSSDVLGFNQLLGDPDSVLDGQHTLTVDGTNSAPGTDFGYAPAAQTTLTGLVGQSIFLDTNGNNTPDAGEGLEGVVVKLYDSTGTILLGTTITDENGNYNFGGLDPTYTYVVQVDPATLPAGVVNSFDPDGTKDAKTTVALSLTNPFILGTNFGFTAINPNTISGTLWQDADMDGTMDAEEMARFAGVTVVLYDTDGNIVATAVTDAGGNYSFLGLPDGNYTVDVTDVNKVISEDMRLSMGLTDPRPVSVSDGSAGKADFGYHTLPASVGNLVFHDYNKNGIQDAGEMGIPSLPVQLTITYPAAGGMTINAETTTTITVRTDTSGFYRFDYLLNDEQFVGLSPAQPLHTISMMVPEGWMASPADQGGSDLFDSDGVLSADGTMVQVVVGSADNAVLVRGAAMETYDFGFNAQPTAINRVSFTDVVSQPGGIRVTWTTDNEQDVVGFVLYRQDSRAEGVWTIINEQAAEFGGSVVGNTYEFLDNGCTSGVYYTYQLEVIRDGSFGLTEAELIVSEPILYNWWMMYLPSLFR